MPIDAVDDDFPRLSISESTLPKACVLTYTNDIGSHKHLMVEVPWKTPDGFIPMTFICNTCAPGGLYLCQQAMRLVRDYLTWEDDWPTIMVVCKDEPLKMGVQSTPHLHEPVNFIGLNGLMRLGMKLDGRSIGFEKTIQWIGNGDSLSTHCKHNPPHHGYHDGGD